jgi:hypothetical protein
MGRLTKLASFGVIIFLKFWIKKGFDGFLPNRSFIAKIMIQSINKSKKQNEGIFKYSESIHSQYFKLRIPKKLV